MPDLAAVQPLYPGPDLVLRRDVQEYDLWARQPLYPGPELIAYPLGPVFFVSVDSGGGGPVTVNTTPWTLTWLALAATPVASVGTSVDLTSVTWASASATAQQSSNLTPETLEWSVVAPATQALTSAALSSMAWTTLATEDTASVSTSTVSLPWVALTATGEVAATNFVSTTPSVVTWATAEIHTWKNRWSVVSNYSISYSGDYLSVSSAVEKGDVVARHPAGGYVTADATALALGAVPVAIALQSPAPSARSIQLQFVGEIPASLVELGTGADSLVRVSSLGKVERIVTPDPSDWIIGRADTNGDVSLFFADARRIRYGTAAPVTGTWSQGTQVINVTPSSGGFIGWVCTVSGTPGTWKTFGVIS